MYRVCEGLEIAGPAGGGSLFGWVGPVGGEMEIEVDSQGFGGEALGEGEDCGEVVGLVIFFFDGKKGKGLEKLGGLDMYM